MEFEWDPGKSRINLEKHGLAFEDAKLVFTGIVVSAVDDRKNYDELRIRSLGLLCGRVVVIVHVERHLKIRIISMRKANEREKRVYEKRLKTRGFNIREKH